MGGGRIAYTYSVAAHHEGGRYHRADLADATEAAKGLIWRSVASRFALCEVSLWPAFECEQTGAARYASAICWGSGLRAVQLVELRSTVAVTRLSVMCGCDAPEAFAWPSLLDGKRWANE